jgi:dTDP-4-dehydrorhamnose reductase
MKILLTGRNGQLGWQLERSLQGLGEIVALDRSQLDLSNLDQVREVIRRVGPGLIVNAAAYTAVDKAETESALAMRINGEAPGVMAELARELGAALIHYSTDYVFDGAKDGPYLEDDPTGPLNAYGKSKLGGEQAIRAIGGRHLILRTSWVYDRRGKNFVLTVLRLATERDQLRIVSDQHGSPTWSRTIADVTAHLVARAGVDEEWWGRHGGLYHLTCGGDTTWHGFARKILTHAGRADIGLEAIPSSAYPTPAARPRNSVLSTARLEQLLGKLPHWEAAFDLCMNKD